MLLRRGLCTAKKTPLTCRRLGNLVASKSIVTVGARAILLTLADLQNSVQPYLEWATSLWEYLRHNPGLLDFGTKQELLPVEAGVLH
jgi:hypothetical protein